MLTCDLPGLKKLKSGKVREMFDLGDSLLMVATDRISAFDVIMTKGIPGKGQVLTMTSALWLAKLANVVTNHLITCDPDEYPEVCQPYKEKLWGRSMLVKKAQPFAVECVVRGYLAGSGWKSYQADRTVCGIQLPPGLKESDKLLTPIFTPATKAKSGHDENISYERMVQIVGATVASIIRAKSLILYHYAQGLAKQAGIIIADTKFEFGIDPATGQVMLIDEVLTPDSSRFWPVDGYAPGGPQPSFDKQYVRDWLEDSGWDKEPPPPDLPDEVVQTTAGKYEEALRLLNEVLNVK
ncbi:MAG: phosphoribosylaminoimidazolesuccinocarboxamide synthase [bacterium]|nr:phosphoribosylaminoimidazolesuccinocarboxamide synthase [bacterium]